MKLPNTMSYKPFVSCSFCYNRKCHVQFVDLSESGFHWAFQFRVLTKMNKQTDRFAIETEFLLNGGFRWTDHADHGSILKNMNVHHGDVAKKNTNCNETNAVPTKFCNTKIKLNLDHICFSFSICLYGICCVR